MKKNILLLLTFLPILLFSQINLKVLDDNGKPVTEARVDYNNQQYQTDNKGTVKIPLATDAQVISVNKDGLISFTKKINPTPKTQYVNVLMRLIGTEKQIQEIIFQGKAKPKTTDLTSIEISAKEAQQVVGLNGGIVDLIKTLPYVNSNTELSSQYMVRGGNYDENLIYINGIELYRPFLIRNSQQEGMSIVNPDMVSNVNFSAGGFEPRYGDKMSSVLNIFYRLPKKFELSGEASLLGGRLTTGFASKNQKLSAIVSARYRNTNLILNTMKQNTDFNPVYRDLQAYVNYDFNPKWSVSFIGNYSRNDFQMIPKEKDVDFGTLQRPLKLTIFYSGSENDKYESMMGTASINFKPNKKWIITLDNFAYQDREREYFSISSGYKLQTFDPVTGDPITNYDAGGQIDHARNDLLVKTYGTQLKTKFSPDPNTSYEIGLKLEKEKLQDLVNEWQVVDSLGYSVPKIYMNPGQLDASKLKLRYNINGQNTLDATRISAYGQFSKKFYWGTNRMSFNGGVRMQNWSYNRQTLVSPRAQLSIKPDWETDMLFRIAGGIYYQAPFYKEIQNLDGTFNPNIKAQKSYHIILGNDYEFKLGESDQPFKLTTEVYYKHQTDLIPYYLDNVRIRYSGQNNATGYSYGIDTRLFGKFVPGVDSWISASYARSYINIDKKGYIPAPTDQRLRLSVFYQDYMPRFPSMRVNLTLVYGMGLPTGAPLSIDPKTGIPTQPDPYQYQRKLPSYKRVDIGLTKIFIDQDENKPSSGSFWGNFKELSLGVQMFNVFNISNTVANQWVNDVNTGYTYPVPVRLTGRFFNVKLDFKL